MAEAGRGPGHRWRRRQARLSLLAFSRPRKQEHIRISLTVNGRAVTTDSESRQLLAHFLREVLHLTGTHLGCETGYCGACTVLVNGRTAKACLMFAVQADGAEIVTIEGLVEEGELHPIQRAFREKYGLQCGFCTPGMVMAALGLLAGNQEPSSAQIKHAIEGNLCRCTGYQSIVAAIDHAAAQMRSKVTGAGTVETAVRSPGLPGMRP